jgi:hypothetical protein
MSGRLRSFWKSQVCISGLKRESFRNGTPSEFVSRLHLRLVVLSWFESSDDVAHCLETGALDLGSWKDHVSPIRSSVDDLPPITVAHAVVHSCVCLVLSSWAEFPLALVVEGLGVSVFRARIVRKPPEQQLVLLDGTERLHGPADVVAVPPAASGGAAEFGRVGLAVFVVSLSFILYKTIQGISRVMVSLTG